MPLVRITLAKGRTQAFKQAFSQAVHQALQQEFNIPEDDLFQIIEEIERENLIFPSSYLSIPHSSQLIYIQIIAMEGRSRSMKQALYQTLCQRVEQDTGHSSDDLVITLIENSAASWSFGRGIAQLVT